jgi:hypothetical protein
MVIMGDNRRPQKSTNHLRRCLKNRSGNLTPFKDEPA